MDVKKFRQVIDDYMDGKSFAEIGISQIIHGQARRDEAMVRALNDANPDPKRFAELLKEADGSIGLGHETILTRADGGVGPAEVQLYLSRCAALVEELLAVLDER